MPASDDRALYIHVPFCRHRCGYCNFTLVAGRDDLIDRYLAAVEAEIGWLDSRHQVKTLFLGGGTPSHLSASQLERLFIAIRNRFDFHEDAEISAECNPNDFDATTCKAFQNCGINRISFGAQSFHASILRFLQRDHSAKDIRNAVELAKTFTNNVSLDLIFATENETELMWLEDLQSAVELEPAHLSTYELTIEKGTQFWNLRNAGSLTELNEDSRADLYEMAIRFCLQHGFEHYEISSFAKPGFQCQHNLSYWNGTEFFAFGPGAASFLNSVRETNHRSTTSYLKRIESNRSPVAEQQVLSGFERALDRLVFGLRQTNGVLVDRFKADTGFDLEQDFGAPLRALQHENLIEMDDNICKLTARGILLYDGVAAKIISEAGR